MEWHEFERVLKKDCEERARLRKMRGKHSVSCILSSCPDLATEPIEGSFCLKHYEEFAAECEKDGHPLTPDSIFYQETDAVEMYDC